MAITSGGGVCVCVCVRACPCSTYGAVWAPVTHGLGVQPRTSGDSLCFTAASILISRRLEMIMTTSASFSRDLSKYYCSVNLIHQCVDLRCATKHEELLIISSTFHSSVR